MSGFMTPNAPPAGYTVSRLVTIGCGSPPTMSVGVVEASRRKIQTQAVAERRRRHLQELLVAGREVIGEPVRGADRHAAVSGHVPCRAAARREIPPLLVHSRLTRRKPGISGVEEPGRRVDELRAAHAAAEIVPVENRRAEGSFVAHLLSEEGLPAKAGVDRERGAWRATNPDRTARDRTGRDPRHPGRRAPGSPVGRA